MLRGKIALRDGPLENLLGGRGGGGSGAGAKFKKIFAQGKIKWKKNSCTAINPKKYSCYGLKFSYKEFDNEKNSCGSIIPHPQTNGQGPRRPFQSGRAKKSCQCKETLSSVFRHLSCICVDYEQSLFSLGPSSKTPEARSQQGPRRGRG